MAKLDKKIKNNCKISVIIPVYNRRDFCDNAYRLLTAQTLQDIEFVFVDDGSTDGSYEYLVKKTKADKRFKIFRSNKNSGPATARNFALKHISGKYIGFFDIDDEIPANYFESLLNTAEQNKSDIVFTSYNNIPHEKIGNITEMADKIASLHNGSLWDKLFLSSLILRNNITFPSGRYCADNVFVFMAFYYAHQITLCDAPVYKYIVRPDSIGFDTQKREKRKQDVLYITEQIMNFVNKKQFNRDSLDATYCFLNRSLNSYRNDADFNKEFQKLTSSIQPNKIIQKNKKNHGGLIMLLLKLGHLFGIISSKKYQERLLRHRVKKSGLFNAKWYLAQNPDVKDSRTNPIKHYLSFGWREGRNPSPKFDNDAYLSMHSDVAAANICPLVHYIQFGRDEGRLIKPVNGAAQQLSRSHSLREKLQYAWEYPIRVHEKYHRLKDKIREIKKSK